MINQIKIHSQIAKKIFSKTVSIRVNIANDMTKSILVNFCKIISLLFFLLYQNRLDIQNLWKIISMDIENVVWNLYLIHKSEINR